MAGSLEIKEGGEAERKGNSSLSDKRRFGRKRRGGEGEKEEWERNGDGEKEGEERRRKGKRKREIIMKKKREEY